MEKTKMRNRARRAMVRGMDGVYHLLSRTAERERGQSTHSNKERERGQSTHSNKSCLHGGTGWVDLVERWLGR